MIELAGKKKSPVSKGVVTSTEGNMVFIKDRFSKVSVACVKNENVTVSEGDEVVFLSKEDQSFVLDKYDKDELYPSNATMTNI